mmetsp:Transcript_14964/g.43222  ORF Transcript_14964/g.43222 Transcript_14964/m.43222 type:complete len:293 (+) Transcript_14964:1703-2581(+)
MKTLGGWDRGRSVAAGGSGGGRGDEVGRLLLLLLLEHVHVHGLSGLSGLSVSVSVSVSVSGLSLSSLSSSKGDGGLHVHGHGHGHGWKEREGWRRGGRRAVRKRHDGVGRGGGGDAAAEAGPLVGVVGLDTNADDGIGFGNSKGTFGGLLLLLLLLLLLSEHDHPLSEFFVVRHKGGRVRLPPAEPEDVGQDVALPVARRFVPAGPVKGVHDVEPLAGAFGVYRFELAHKAIPIWNDDRTVVRELEEAREGGVGAKMDLDENDPGQLADLLFRFGQVVRPGRIHHGRHGRQP